MAGIQRSLLRPPEGFRSREAASFFAQLEDLSGRLLEAIRDVSPKELEWQPAPGMNTIGMLLAHNAIAEVFWVQIALLRLPQSDATPVLGMNDDGDGMPLPPDGAPPAHLAGKVLSYYEDLLSKARAYCREAAAALEDHELDREITRTRPDGSHRVFNPRWAMYHMVEHYGGHFGQILLLRHSYRSIVEAPSR